MSAPLNTNVSPFGAKTSKGQLYGGFSLLIGGIVVGLAALTLFFISLSQSSPYGLRHIALPLGAAGFATLLLGATVALPTKTAMRVLSYFGVGLCALATVLLAFHYPTHFNISGRCTATPTNPCTDFLVLDLGLYVGGMAMLVASIFTSIIGYYLDRLAPQGEGKADGEGEDEFAGYEVPDWVVERDIEFAMQKYGVELGGRSDDKNKLYVNIPTELGGNVKVGGLGKAKTVQIDAEQVDMGVKELAGVRPNKKGALPGEWADESTKALVAFRRQKAANPTAFTPKVGFWAKVKSFFLGTGSSAPRVTDSKKNLAPTAAPKGARTPTKAPGPNGVAPPARRGTTIVIPDEPSGKGRN